jgi:small subunit ribosomal protein S1
MTDEDKNANSEAEFASLLDAYSPTEKSDLQVGDKVKGKIISIGKDSIFIDIGNKIDGIVETAEMLDKDKQLAHKEFKRLFRTGQFSPA